MTDSFLIVVDKYPSELEEIIKKHKGEYNKKFDDALDLYCINNDFIDLKGAVATDNINAKFESRLEKGILLVVTYNIYIKNKYDKIFIAHLASKRNDITSKAIEYHTTTNEIIKVIKKAFKYLTDFFEYKYFISQLRYLAAFEFTKEEKIIIHKQYIVEDSMENIKDEIINAVLSKCVTTTKREKITKLIGKSDLYQFKENENILETMYKKEWLIKPIFQILETIANNLVKHDLNKGEIDQIVIRENKESLFLYFQRLFHSSGVKLYYLKENLQFSDYEDTKKLFEKTNYIQIDKSVNSTIEKEISEALNSTKWNNVLKKYQDELNLINFLKINNSLGIKKSDYSRTFVNPKDLNDFREFLDIEEFSLKDILIKTASNNLFINLARNSLIIFNIKNILTNITFENLLSKFE